MPHPIPLGLFDNDGNLLYHFKSKHEYVNLMGLKSVPQRLRYERPGEPYTVGTRYHLASITRQVADTFPIDVDQLTTVLEHIKGDIPWSVGSIIVRTIHCKECAETKPWTNEYFSTETRNNGTIHLRTTCRDCRRSTNSDRVAVKAAAVQQHATFMCKGNDITGSHEASTDIRLTDRDQCKECYRKQRSDKTESYAGQVANLREHFKDVYDICSKCGQRKNVGKYFIMRAGSKLGYRKLCLRDCKE